MKLIKELLTLQEDGAFGSHEIPTRVRRYMHENDITYPGVESLEDLKRAHAKQILAKGGKKGIDSEERGLSYALGMDGLSDEELEDVANPKPVAVDGPDNWDFTANDPGLSGCDSLRTNMPDSNGQEFYWHIAVDHVNGGTHDPAWECSATDEDGQPDYDKTEHFMAKDLDYVREKIEDWCDKHDLPWPTDEQFKQIGL